MTRKILYSLFLVFILADIGYSFLQHYNTPLDGSMAGGIVPSEEVRPILESPLGMRVFITKETYPNPNRFFCHWLFNKYFNHIPIILQKFVNPLDSVYLSCAISKIIIQIILIVLLSILISGNTNMFKFESLLAAVLIIPFFQTNGYRSHMGIIDPATTYTFFYALPTALLLLYFSPLILQRYYGKEFKGFKYISILWIPLALVCSLSGPMNPGIALIFSMLLIINNLIMNFRKSGHENILDRIKYSIQKIPRVYYFFIIPIVIFSLYSIYLGRYNSVSLSNKMSLASLYAKLPEGIYYQFTQKLGFPVLFSILIINTLIIKSQFKTIEGRKILKTFKWIGIFAIIYILLLPFGGYRDYRKYILRYDTIMPITLSLMFIFGKMTILILNNISLRQKSWYIPLIMLVIFIFTNSDEPKFDKNDCERDAINQIAESPESIVKISDECNVLSWDKIEDPNDSELQSKLLQLWGIIDEKKLYYQ